MRVPISWLRELVDLPAELSGRQIADRLINAGLEVETVDEVGADLSGPLVIGRVVAFTEEEHSNGKTVRWCRVDVGPEHNEPGESGEPDGRGIVCGARNFDPEDLVVVALPGTTLPGGFEIGARKTYGHVSDGMICSTRELGVGEDHDGIWILPEGVAAPGAPAPELLGLRDEVLVIDVTPDRGYAESLRGIARDSAIAFGLVFTDPAAIELAPAEQSDWPVRVDDAVGCDRFVTRSVVGLDVTRTSPMWMQRRLHMCGMRPISLAVDITNYVMLELGQPLHAYDRTRLSGTIVVRRAHGSESLMTLDGTARSVDESDLLITDDSGPIGVAGVMGGASTEIDAATSDIVIEAAHFDAATISRGSRRHRLPSEASRRFARGVDARLQEYAAERAVRLLAELGGAEILPGRTLVDTSQPATAIELDLELPGRLVGRSYSSEQIAAALEAAGCLVAVGAGAATVTPPSWRPDLLLPEDLVEEVARIQGYDTIPSLLPTAPAGGGLTDDQRLRRRIGLTLAGAGYVEVLSYPFIDPKVHDAFGLPADDPRRSALRLANPLSDEEPELRTSLLPGLLATLKRNVGRGADDLALFELGSVYRPETEQSRHPHNPPRPGVDRPPTRAEIAALEALLPRQPRRVAVVLTGRRERAGWWGPGRLVEWSDAVEAARLVAATAGVAVDISNDVHQPWHPGRCAVLRADGELVGHAGELHPGVIAALGLPERTCAMELELDALERHIAAAGPSAPVISTYPVAKADVALTVAADTAASEVAAALTAGGGSLLESVRLFDVYVGEQVGEGKRSLAFALRFRAPDRTLSTEEVAAARDAAVAEATRTLGAALRG